MTLSTNEELTMPRNTATAAATDDVDDRDAGRDDLPETPAPTAKKSSKKKTAFPSALGRGTIHYLDARPPAEGGNMIFIGVDTPDGPEHILWSRSARNTEFNEQDVLTIMDKGILQAGYGRKNGENCEVIFGRRRLVNLREANRRLVALGREPYPFPVVKFEGTDQELLEILMIENTQRQQESDEELARQAAHLLRLGRPKERVAQICGFNSVTGLNNLLKINELVPELRSLIGTGPGQVAREAVVQLANKDFDTQRQEAATIREQIAAGERVTARTVRERIDPEGPSKPKKSQLARVIAMLDADAGKPKGKRYFEIDDPADFAAKLLKVALGECKASVIKGLTKVLDGRVEVKE